MVEQEDTHASPVLINSACNQNFLNWIIIDSSNFINEDPSCICEDESLNVKHNEDFNSVDHDFLCHDEKLLCEIHDDCKPQEEIVASSNPSFESDPNFYWGTCQYPFQVDKDDLIQGPTLAELNANESVLDSFDLFHQEGPSICQDFNLVLMSQPNFDNKVEQNDQNISPKKSATVTNESELEYNCSNELQYASNFVKMPESGKAEAFDSSQVICISDSEEDSFESSDTDAESNNEEMSQAMATATCKSLEKKKTRYFWQYNMQSKGPKGNKMRLAEKSSACDGLGISDPVQNAGKPRRGDGNDFTPNPKKLYNIGIELDNLNSIINQMTPANELSASSRAKSRKEKNKLASRACRLKKKAQHEANKIKLFGIQKEQKQLNKCIDEIKKVLSKRLEKKVKKGLSSFTAVDSVIKKKAVTKVAGCTTEYVNKVLTSVASGDETGSLENM